MRAANSVAIGLAAIAVAVATTGLSAHRRDELLQAARIGIEPTRVEVELDLTPGMAVAEAMIGAIDRDGDGLLSGDEKQTYVSAVVADIELLLDGRPIRVESVKSTFPDVDAFRRGEGVLRLQLAADAPEMSGGEHHLLFQNTHKRDVSVYLANALVPATDRIGIIAQRRDGAQSDLTIDYRVRGSAAGFNPAWLLIVIVAGAGVGRVLGPAAGSVVGRVLWTAAGSFVGRVLWTRQFHRHL